MMNEIGQEKNSGRLAVVGVTLVLILLATAASISVAANVVSFPDIELEAVIRDAISKPTGDIYDGDLIGLTFLDARYCNISNLEGVQHCTDLSELYLGDNNIIDISPLAGLANLRVLDLDDNQIVDISALSGLTNLTKLYLGNNIIIDISPLSNLTNLTLLYLWYNEIIDISPLAGLSNLTGLILLQNRIVDISPLSSLTNLTALGLGENKIIDISPLAGLTNLTALALWDNEIIDISPLAGLSNLSELYLYDNRISDISPLSNLTNLTLLNLSFNDIIDISSLAGLSNLFSLNLSVNQIVDIGPLVNNAGIGTRSFVHIWDNNLCLSPSSPDQLDVDALLARGVSVSYENQTCVDDASVVVNFPDPGLEAAIRDAIGTPTGDILDTDLIGLTHLDARTRSISNLEGIQHCDDLTKLNLYDNQIGNINPISNLVSLSWLNLSKNQIVDISQLSGLINLDVLSLYGNQIVNISTLAALTRLEALDLYDNQIVDISPLTNLIYLSYLSVANNQIVDISALATLTGLRVLGLYSNQIVDISTLATLLGLKELVLHDNQIMDITALAGLTSIEGLWVERNRLDLTPGSPTMQIINAIRDRGVYCEYSPQTIVVIFPDPGLESAVREMISKPAGDIYETDLMAWEELNAVDQNIFNLDGIEYCTNLTSISLAANQIVNIAPLSGLSNLSALDLSNNKVTDIAPLSSLSNLRSLDLSSNKLTDIAPLFGLTSLALGILDDDTFVVIRNDPFDLMSLEPLSLIEGVRATAALRRQTAFFQGQPDVAGEVLRGFLPAIGLSPVFVAELEPFIGALEILPGGRTFEPGDREVAILGHEISQRLTVDVGDTILVSGTKNVELNLTIIGIRAPLERNGPLHGEGCCARLDSDAIVLPSETMDLLWRPADDVLITLVYTEPGYNVDEVAEATEEVLNTYGTEVSSITFNNYTALFGLPNLTTLWLEDNQLDLTLGSLAMGMIESLQRGGIDVDY